MLSCALRQPTLYLGLQRMWFYCCSSCMFHVIKSWLTEMVTKATKPICKKLYLFFNLISQTNVSELCFWENPHRWPLTFPRSSWELPDLRDGKIQAISDSDGVNYPWYGNTTETCTVVGPTKKDSKFTVSMNDNFYPSVTWGVPVSDSNVPQLSSIHRDQSFTTWLVAINQATSETLVLQTIRWRMRLHIRVDPEKPLGHRAVLTEPLVQEQPQIMGKNEPIPTNAMVKPNANDAQVLMWRPKNGDPVVVIPPKYWPASLTRLALDTLTVSSLICSTSCVPARHQLSLL